MDLHIFFRKLQQILFGIIFADIVQYKEKRRRDVMLAGQLKQAFELSKKYRMDVSTVTELQKIVAKEIDSSSRVEMKVLTQILQMLENNKTFLREAQ